MENQTENPAAAQIRNPIGWFLFASLSVLMIGVQLATYFSRTPNIAVLRSEAAEHLQTVVKASAIAGNAEEKVSLAPDEKSLEGHVLDDPETGLLYASIRTEEGKPIDVAKLTALRNSKDQGYAAAFQIYSKAKLTKAEANSLGSAIPRTSFLYKLVIAQAHDKAGEPAFRQALLSEGLGIQGAVIAVLSVLVLSGFVLLNLYFFRRASGRSIPKGLALDGLTLVDADKVALRSAQMLLVFFGASIGVGLLLPKAISDFGAYLAAFAGIWYLTTQSVNGKRLTWRDLGVSKDNLGTNILWGVGGAIANLPIIAVAGVIGNVLFRALPTPEHPVTAELTQSAPWWLVLKLVVIASVLVPVIEESIFRATLFPAMARVLKSPVFAGIVTSLLFAAFHPTGIPAWPGLAAIGGMSCCLTYQTRSLVPSIVMHAVHNFGVLVFTLALASA